MGLKEENRKFLIDVLYFYNPDNPLPHQREAIESFDLYIEKFLIPEWRKKPAGVAGDVSLYGGAAFVITSPFRPSHRPNHNGIDTSACEGAALYSLIDGTVTRAGGQIPGTNGDCKVGDASCGGAYGNTVYVTCDNVEIRYAHLKEGSIVVKPGQKIAAGQMIGCQGNTGRSTGSHLHFEYRVNGNPINPIGNFIDEKGNLIV